MQDMHAVPSKDPEKKGEIVGAHTSEGLVGPEHDLYEDGNLKRQLKNRHIAMISIGGVIG